MAPRVQKSTAAPWPFLVAFPLGPGPKPGYNTCMIKRDGLGVRQTTWKRVPDTLGCHHELSYAAVPVLDDRLDGEQRGR